jgi:Zn-dependent metalloprotease
MRTLMPFLVLLIACRPDGAALLDETGPNADALALLEAETGHPWTLRRHAELGTPAFLEGRTPPMAATVGDARRVGPPFLQRHRALFQLGSAKDELDETRTEIDPLGMIHVHYQQRHARVPVWEAGLSLHFDHEGALVRIFARYVPPGAPPDPTPGLSADQARVAAALAVRTGAEGSEPAGVATRTPKLWYLALGQGALRLAWRVEVEVADPAAPLLAEVFVDAVDGDILRVVDILDRVAASGLGSDGTRRPLAVVERQGKLWLEDAARGLKTYSAGGRHRAPGSQVWSRDPERWDDEGPGAGAAVDAHAGLAQAWDVFSTALGHRGAEGEGEVVRATVHFGAGLSHAYWNGRHLLFGDGDGVNTRPFSAGLDVIAHELAHGLVAHTAGLAHDGETGALHEAIADLFACLAEAEALGGTDWTIGERVRFDGTPLRHLADPATLGAPAHLGERVITDDDKGGVHVNSTIVSHAAYLAATGAQGHPALGVARTARIFYRALRYYLHPRAGFSDAADATLAAARDLGLDAEALRRAFQLAGILPA